MKLPRISWPYLEIWIALPFFALRTELLHKSFQRLTYEYIGMYIKLWKWEWRFRLYRPGGRND